MSVKLEEVKEIIKPPASEEDIQKVKDELDQIGTYAVKAGNKVPVEVIRQDVEMIRKWYGLKF